MGLAIIYNLMIGQLGAVHLAVGTYFWRVRAKNEAGESDWSEIWSFSISDPTGLERSTTGIPTTLELAQNYPNPFNPTTTIEFGIPKSTFTSLAVYNMLGKKEKSLVNMLLPAGYYKIKFDASDLPSGIYLYKLQTNKAVKFKKMILVK